MLSLISFNLTPLYGRGSRSQDVVPWRGDTLNPHFHYFCWAHVIALRLYNKWHFSGIVTVLQKCLDPLSRRVMHYNLPVWKEKL